MKKILTIILLQGFASYIFAQTESQVTGQVRDALTREAVVGATIYTVVNGQKMGSLTDTTGQFSLSFSGTKTTVTVAYIGYRTWANQVMAKQENLTILLEPADNLLSGVVVTGTMKEVMKEVSPIPVEVYTPRFFQKSASPSFFEAIGMVNGMRPQLNCNICNTGDIHINGMEGPYTMITIDGMPIVSGLATVYGLSGIPNGIVERIEVVKGPASTLYGSEAVGGLINIITKSPLTAPRFFVDGFGTSIGETNVDVAFSRAGKRVSTLVGANYFRFNELLDINHDNFTDIPQQDRVSIFNKWSFTGNRERSSSVALRYVYENRWGGQLNWEPRWRGTDSVYGESIYTNRFELLGRQHLPTRHPVTLDYSYNIHDQNSVYGTTVLLANQQVGFGQLTTRLAPGKNQDLLMGAALRYTRYDDNTPATASPDASGNLPSHVWLPGIFVQDEITLNARSILLAGLRYDYNSVHGSIFTPRLSYKYSFSAQNILRLTTGSGYRVANIFTEDHAALTGAREVVTAENLLPERSWNGNVNYVCKFYPRRAGFIALDASLFYTYFTNQILPDYNTDPNKIIYKNLDGHAVSSGATVNLDFNFLNGLKIIAGATAMNVYRIESGKRLPQLFAPPISGTWTVTYPVVRWGLTFDYTGNLNGPMHLPVLPNDPRPEQSPWFAIHNVQITKVFKKNLEVYLGIKNLFGFYPQEEVILRAFDPFDKNVDVNNPYGHTFDPAYNYAPIQRQRVLLGLRWTLRK